ncbi:MAG: hypothetical protein M3540_07055 [Actinomycetota bacterium]|nr:hypothetical protein [Actinomycetota bacterium]
MTTPLRSYTEAPATGSAPDVPYWLNQALREIDTDVAGVDGRITPAQTAAVASAKTYTDTTASAAQTAAVASAKTYTDAADALLSARHTVTAADPEGAYNNIPGAVHLNTATGRRWLKATGTGNTGWTILPRNLERGRPVSTSNLNGWNTAATNGRWEIQDYASMDAMTAAGTTFPVREPGYWDQYVSAIGIVYQEYTLYGPKQATYKRTSTGWNTGLLTGWEKARVDLPVSKTSLLHAVGDSMVENGDNGTIWPPSDQWPAKLAALLPAGAVVNRGQSGSFVDEALLHTGARPMSVKVTSGTIPTTGGTPVELSWPVHVNTDKFVTCVGRLQDKAVAIDRSGTTGAWTIRQVAGIAPLAVTGWGAFTPDWAGNEALTHAIWIGRNNITYGIKGVERTVADHVVAGVQELVSYLSARNKRYVLLGVHSRTAETGADPNLATVNEINARLRSVDPGHTALAQDWFREKALAAMGITPTQNDQDLVAAGTIPASLLAAGDVTHMSKATAAAVAQHHLLPWLTAKGYLERI